MSLTIYVDESGNTGDVFVKKAEDFFFNSQPYFVLAAVGIPNRLESNVKEIINDLRANYRIQSDELKVKNKPFSIELMQNVFDMGMPIFVEVTHKKYFLSIQLCNLIIKPLIDDLEVTDEFLEFKRSSADLILNIFPDSIYFEFCKVCRTRDTSSFELFMYTLHQFLLNEPDMVIYAELVEENMKEYIHLKQEYNLPKPAYEFFLPLPDKNKRGELINSLPHIPSLANICMRAEKYRQIRGMSKINYIHDEQKQLWDILFDNVSFLMQNLDVNYFNNSHLKYSISPNLPTDTSLTVGVSEENNGILIADVIARSFYRYWVDYEKKSILDKDYSELFRKLQQPQHKSYFGVNMVLPQIQVDQFQFATGQK
ncbi:hypothetical protein D3C74_142920 [compost metagenome]